MKVHQAARPRSGQIEIAAENVGSIFKERLQTLGVIIAAVGEDDRIEKYLGQGLLRVPCRAAQEKVCETGEEAFHMPFSIFATCRAWNLSGEMSMTRPISSNSACAADTPSTSQRA